MSARTLLTAVTGLILALCVTACSMFPASALPEQDESNPSVESDSRDANRWFAAGRKQVANAARLVPKESPAKNVILFVGDGMGIATVTAARILEGQNKGQTGEENRLSFEELPFVALSKTYSVDAQVSDSAATMTAMVSGVKTLAGVLGVDEQIRRGDHSSVAAARVLTILEEAEDRGLATGVVSTAPITHATPGGCYSHVPLRSWQSDSSMSKEAQKAGFPDIARQLVDFAHGDGLEIALGGGRSHFLAKKMTDPEYPDQAGQRSDGRDLTKEWIDARDHSTFVWNRDQLRAVDLGTTRHLLGLFEPGNMKYEADRETDPAGEPTLAEMTAIAIDALARDTDGFFLMVEGGRIDHGHHAGNAYRALTDTIAFSDAVRVALEKTNREETLIVVTADHSHTLTISGYPNRGNPILGKVMGQNWRSGNENELARDRNGKPYTTLGYANGPGYVDAAGRPDLHEIDTASPDYKQESIVPLRSETHAGEDVPIYAGGPRAALFHGVQEQNYIYHAMVEALGWTQNGRPVD